MGWVVPGNASSSGSFAPYVADVNTLLEMGGVALVANPSLELSQVRAWAERLDRKGVHVLDDATTPVTTPQVEELRRLLEVQGGLVVLLVSARLSAPATRILTDIVQLRDGGRVNVSALVALKGASSLVGNNLLSKMDLRVGEQ